MFDNLLLIRDAIRYVQQKNSPLALLKIDQEKAFDRVNWEFLDSVLVRMNFGQIFQHFIKYVYTDVASCVLNNGHKSGTFLLQRGVWQGCPLSPLLYCLVTETLGNVVCANPSISKMDLH